MSNEKFLQALFGADAPRAWVTGFTAQPFAPGTIPDKKAAAKLAATMWGGGMYAEKKRRLKADANQYVAVSVFAPGADGVVRRRKDNFEQMRALMVDDIGPKVKPAKVVLPLTVRVETSPGNCQGWYALDASDPDTRDRALCERIVDAMIAAGLTNDGKDSGMKGVTRYGRLPEGINNKPGRDVWPVQMREYHPERVYKLRDIARAYKLDIDAVPQERKRANGNGSHAQSLVPVFAAMGLNPMSQGNGKYEITCPWVDEHSDRVDTGTAYFEPSDANHGAGGFKCHHGHCEERTIADVFRWVENGGRKTTQPQRVARTHKLPTEFTADELLEMDVPETEWLVEDLLAPGMTLFAAPPKSGKSYLALQLAICVSTGQPFLGKPTRNVPVAYFDLEEWHGLLKERLVPVRRAHADGVKLNRLLIKLEAGIGAEFFADLERVIAAGCRLVIIDLFARVRDELNEDSKKNAYARDYAAVSALSDFALSHPELALVVVHHTNKRADEGEWQMKISGSQGLAGASHTNWMLAAYDLRGKSEEEKEALRRFRKLHMVGKQVRDQTHVIEMMERNGGWQISTESPDDVGGTMKQQQIVRVLSHKPGAWFTAQEVADILGMKHANVRQIMRRMAHASLIESDGQGGNGYRFVKGS